VAELSFSEELSLTVNADLPNEVDSQSLHITNDNRYTKMTYEVCYTVHGNRLSIVMVLHRCLCLE